MLVSCLEREPIQFTTSILGNENSPSTNIFRVALGNVAVIPSSSRVSITWQPNRDVSVRAKAISSMSFSSSYIVGHAADMYFECGGYNLEGYTPPVLVAYRSASDQVLRDMLNRHKISRKPL